MNIKRAKQEIKDTVEAYLLKDEYGDYCIPAIRQRPILLMGPPGIGKTQIMEQAARECGINLVSYTITHHTRQSAIGLPFIKEKSYGGETRSVTEYTMSEIIASVYDKMEATGIREGILFIDEINCVSETLAPAMLQFLQCKTFGNQQRENFYRMETSIDGRMFATPRGWEDLSQLLYVYEKLGKRPDREVVCQYIQHWKVAKDFANYLDLFEKYKTDYQVDQVLAGHFEKFAVEKLRMASLDERFAVVGLFMGKLGEGCRAYHEKDLLVTELFEVLKSWKKALESAEHPWQALEDRILMREKDLEEKKKADLLTREEEHLQQEILRILGIYRDLAKEEEARGEGKEEIFRKVKEAFQDQAGEREELIKDIGEKLQNTFDFLEMAFAEGQELVVFVTELNTNPYSMEFISENGCDSYYKYNKKLLFDQEQREILEELENIEEEL